MGSIDWGEGMQKPLKDFMDRQVRKMAQAAASILEAKILAGCNRCGRRLVQDGKPIPGAALVGPASVSEAIMWGKEIEALCAECQT